MRAVVAVVIVVGAAAFAPAAAWAAASDITVTRSERLSPRLLEFGLRTPALPAETNLRVLLPDGYDAEPGRRWPVLYLLHGCCDYDVPGSRAWTTHGEAQEATAGLPLIVVMPDAGRGGFYSDWRMPGTMGRPQWETYRLDQLMPWIDREFRTRAEREGRAIAGLSMGGFGTMKYAALHPDLFVAAASFSGAVDTNFAGGVLDALAAQDGGYPGAIWGPRATDEVRWRGDNPWDLAENLRPLRLTLLTGNGQPGPLDEPGGAPYDPVEAGVHDQTVSLHERLTDLRIEHAYDDYGPGTHSWPYWARDLRQTLAAQIMPALADPPAAPARVTYTTIDPRYDIYGWHVAIERPAPEFSRLEDASRDGFVLAGSGAATVRTPAAYPPAATIAVTIGGADGGGTRTADIVADRDGHLLIPVPLGAGNAGQQLQPAVATRVTRATVRIAAPPVGCRSRRVVTVTLRRGLRRTRATLDGRRIRVRGRRVRVDLRGRPPGTARLVVRASTRSGRPYRLVRRYRTC